MKVIEWSDHYLTGHEQTDQRHKEIIQLLNDMVEQQAVGQYEGCTNSLGDCLEVCERHIAEENDVLLELKSPDITEHMMDHEALIKKMKKLKAGCATGCSGDTCLTDIAHTLLSHILRHDIVIQHAYGEKQRYSTI